MSRKIIALKDVIGNLVWGGRQLWPLSRRIMVFMAVMALIGSMLPACLAIVTRYLINTVSDITNGGSQEIARAVYPVLLTLLVITLQSICTAVSAYLSQLLRENNTLKISCLILEHSAKLDLAFFEDTKKQDILAHVRQNGISHFSGCFVSALDLSSDMIKLVSLSAILVVIEPLVALIILPLFFPYLVFKVRLTRNRYTIHHNQVLKKRWVQYITQLLTTPEKVAEIKLLNIAGYFIDTFKKYMSEFFVQERTLYKHDLVGVIVFSTIANLAIAGLLFKIIFQAMSGALTIGDVVVFIGTSANLRLLLERSTRLLSTIHEHSLYIGSVKKFLQFSAEPIEGVFQRPIESAEDAVEVRDVSFSYPGSDTRVLNHVTLKIKHGETVAIVGENAAGKTSLAKLIAGLYKPDDGAIFLHGRDIRHYSQEQLSENVSFVFQNFGRYEASVADNIAIGNWKDLADNNEKVKEIAEKVQIAEAINRYPDKFATTLGRLFGDYDPSGGEWQYIAIARAFAKQPSLLILDEPTASLDVKSENRLFRHFKELAAGTTTLLISHRLSTVKIADRIIVLNEGSVEEQGTHEELLEAQGRYAAMFKIYQDQMGFVIQN